MAHKPLLVDLSQIDLDRVVADVDEIRKYNPQRHEMEQLTAVVFEDTEVSVGPFCAQPRVNRIGVARRNPQRDYTRLYKSR